jgi:hypothetical protein
MLRRSVLSGAAGLPMTDSSQWLCHGVSASSDIDTLDTTPSPPIWRCRARSSRGLATCHSRSAGASGVPAGCGLWLPKTCSRSCDQVIFVDQATDLGVFSDAVQVEIDRFG